MYVQCVIGSNVTTVSRLRTRVLICNIHSMDSIISPWKNSTKFYVIKRSLNLVKILISKSEKIMHSLSIYNYNSDMF